MRNWTQIYSTHSCHLILPGLQHIPHEKPYLPEVRRSTGECPIMGSERSSSPAFASKHCQLKWLTSLGLAFWFRRTVISLLYTPPDCSLEVLCACFYGVKLYFCTSASLVIMLAFEDTRAGEQWTQSICRCLQVHSECTEGTGWAEWDEIKWCCHFSTAVSPSKLVVMVSQWYVFWKTRHLDSTLTFQSSQEPHCG